LSVTGPFTGIAPAARSAIADPAVARALELIEADPGTPLSVDRLARHAGVSRSVLGERFRQAVGQPPMRYLARYRLQAAAAHLAASALPIAQISYEAGFSSEAAFSKAFRREFGTPPATWRRLHGQRGAQALAQSEIAYCRTPDGPMLAWSQAGDGFPLVKAANWLNHLVLDWESPVWMPLMRELTRGNRLIRYDERGTGLSDWNIRDISFARFVDDLEAVVDAAGLDRFDLFGISQGAAVAVAYCHRHPGRVRRLVMHGGYATGWQVRSSAEERRTREAMITLTRTGWGAEHGAFREMFTRQFIPGATREQTEWFNELQRTTTSPENAARIQEALGPVDVRPFLASVNVPTLIFHARRDQMIPYEAGVMLARGIRGARFVKLDSDRHVPMDDDCSWPVFCRELRAFLDPE
jgi:pimeloyl-ACP methyl ester carboxylesterase/AraC-like DNA-binding protein